jgi:hypothetical protein
MRFNHRDRLRVACPGDEAWDGVPSTIERSSARQNNRAEFVSAPVRGFVGPYEVLDLSRLGDVLEGR